MEKPSKEEVLVIETLGKHDFLTFEEIREHTGISSEKLEKILAKLEDIGVASKTEAKGSVHVENDKRHAVIHIFEKKK